MKSILDALTRIMQTNELTHLHSAIVPPTTVENNCRGTLL